MRILALSGSLRKGSSNTALLWAIKAMAPETCQIDIYEGLGELPYFNPDLDGDVPPLAVQNLRLAICASNALLISTPEYAHGIPGMLKNALDWLVSDPSFVGKPVGIICGAASEGSYALEALI